MPQNPTDEKSTLIQVMACCRSASSHYLNKFGPRPMSRYRHTRPQWVNIMEAGTKLPPHCRQQLQKHFIEWKVLHFNSLKPRQNGSHFADDIFKCIFLNENDWIPIEISLKFVPKGPINNIPALVQIMAWRLSGDKPLSESMMVRLPTHICVTRPQWVN